MRWLILLLPLSLLAQVTTSGKVVFSGLAKFNGTASLNINLPSAVGWSPVDGNSMCGANPCAGTTFVGSAADPGTVANALCTTDPACTPLTSYNFSTNLASWYQAFSDATYDPDDERLYAFGGGHSDSRISLTAYLDLKGSSPSWHLVSNPIPLPPANLNVSWVCIDPLVVLDNTSHTNYGNCVNPMSAHTFNLLNYSASIKAMIMVGGFLADQPNTSNEVWNLDTASGNWSLTTPYGGNPLGTTNGIAPTALDPTTGRLWESDYSISGKTVYYVPTNATTGTWTTWLSSGSATGTGQIGYSVIDPVDHIMVVTSVETRIALVQAGRSATTGHSPILSIPTFAAWL